VIAKGTPEPVHARPVLGGPPEGVKLGVPGDLNAKLVKRGRKRSAALEKMQEVKLQAELSPQGRSHHIIQ
jgi:hypothetical protein